MGRSSTTIRTSIIVEKPFTWPEASVRSMHHSFSDRSRSKTVRETFEKHRAIKENISLRSFVESLSTRRTSPVRLFSEGCDLDVGDASVGRCMQTSSPGYGIERAVIRDVCVAADLGEERVIRGQPGHEEWVPRFAASS